MLPTIFEGIRVFMIVFCAIGAVIATGMSVYAIWNEDIPVFKGLVFWVVVYLSWPVMVYEAIADEVKIWAHDHLDIRER